MLQDQYKNSIHPETTEKILCKTTKRADRNMRSQNQDYVVYWTKLPNNKTSVKDNRKKIYSKSVNNFKLRRWKCVNHHIEIIFKAFNNSELKK